MFFSILVISVIQHIFRKYMKKLIRSNEKTETELRRCPCRMSLTADWNMVEACQEVYIEREMRKSNCSRIYVEVRKRLGLYLDTKSKFAYLLLTFCGRITLPIVDTGVIKNDNLNRNRDEAIYS